MFEVHTKYVVLFTRDDGKRMRMLGTYLGVNYAGAHLFDVRPDGGTQTIVADAITHSQTVGKHYPHVAPKVSEKQ